MTVIDTLVPDGTDLRKNPLVGAARPMSFFHRASGSDSRPPLSTFQRPRLITESSSRVWIPPVTSSLRSGRTNAGDLIAGAIQPGIARLSCRAASETEHRQITRTGPGRDSLRGRSLRPGLVAMARAGIRSVEASTVDIGRDRRVDEILEPLTAAHSTANLRG